MTAFIHALILCLVFEGIAFALFPSSMRRAMLEASQLDDKSLRALGGMALALALIIIFGLRLWD